MYTIIGKSSCPYCVKAMQVLDTMNLKYQYTSLDTNESAVEEFKRAGYKTVPQIFLGDRHIGGYNELEDHLLKEI